MSYMKYIFGFTALLFFGSRFVALVFISESDVIPLASFAIKCVAIYLPFISIATVYAHYTLSCSLTRVTTAINILNNAFVALYGCIFVRIAGVEGVLAALPTCGISLCIYILVRTQIHCKKLIPTLDDFLMLDELVNDEGISHRSWSISPGKLAASDCSKEVYDFFTERGVAQKNCYHLSLIAEETLENILRCGFRDNKRHGVLVSAVYQSGGECTLCIEDDCKPFDPFEKRALMKELNEDGPNHTGLKIICGIAKDIQYVNTISTNTLMVKIHKDAEAQQSQAY